MIFLFTFESYDEIPNMPASEVEDAGMIKDQLAFRLKRNPQTIEQAMRLLDALLVSALSVVVYEFEDGNDRAKNTYQIERKFVVKKKLGMA